ncbi:MAG: sulfatase-like hydrolase/transferase, partial [Verrucomicrobium sp.]
MNFLSSALLAATLSLATAAAALAADRPNILFLFSDDQRADTIGALGNPGWQTPNLDRLVKEGTAFSRAYCMGSQQGAVCVPSRAMLMTGRGLYHVKEQLKGQGTWPESFAAAGYQTFMTGKWHNGAAAALRTFQDGRAVFLGGMGSPYELTVQDMDPKTEGADRQFVDKRKVEKHCVELFADQAVNFVTA